MSIIPGRPQPITPRAPRTRCANPLCGRPIAAGQRLRVELGQLPEHPVTDGHLRRWDLCNADCLLVYLRLARLRVRCRRELAAEVDR